MVNAGSAYRLFIEKLEGIYGIREAENITKLVFRELLPPGFDNPAAGDDLSSRKAKVLMDILRRMVNEEPVQYVLGAASFYGLKFRVDHSVLIPRPETEELVDWIVKEGRGGKILDVGTGSGCIAIALKVNIPKADVEAIDVSKAAVRVARINSKINEAPVTFKVIDFTDDEQCQALGTYDIIVSNPPYIRVSEKGSLPGNVALYEPPEALFVPGDDPFTFHIRLASFSLSHLNKGGMLYMETGETKKEALMEKLGDMEFSSIEFRKDLSGKDRMVKATL